MPFSGSDGCTLACLFCQRRAGAAELRACSRVPCPLPCSAIGQPRSEQQSPAPRRTALPPPAALCICSLGALKGWKTMFGHLLSKERLPFAGGARPLADWLAAGCMDAGQGVV